MWEHHITLQQYTCIQPYMSILNLGTIYFTKDNYKFDCGSLKFRLLQKCQKRI